MDPIAQLALFAAFFLAIHRGLSGTRLRDVIAERIGEAGFGIFFSILSLAGLVGLAMSYNAAFAAPANHVLFDLGPGVAHSGLIVMAVAFLLGVTGILTPNPTSAGQQAVAARPDAAEGILAITRHPFLWGAAIWAAFHLAANGDVASVLFFGAFVVLTVTGTFSIDAKRRRRMGSQWEGFAAKTSNVPFAALIAGRARLRPGRLFDWRFLAAVAAYGVFLLIHGWAFGASPFPGGWVPF